MRSADLAQVSPASRVLVCVLSCVQWCHTRRVLCPSPRAGHGAAPPPPGPSRGPSASPLPHSNPWTLSDPLPPPVLRSCRRPAPPWNDAFVPFLEEDADKVRGLWTLGPPRALSLPGAEGHKDGASPGLRGPFCGLLVRGRVDWFSWQVRGATWPRAGPRRRGASVLAARGPALYPEDAKRIVRVGRSLGVSGRRQKTSGLPRTRGSRPRESAGARRGRCGPAPSRALRVRP